MRNVATGRWSLSRSLCANVSAVFSLTFDFTDSPNPFGILRDSFLFTANLNEVQSHVSGNYWEQSSVWNMDVLLEWDLISFKLLILLTWLSWPQSNDECDVALCYCGAWSTRATQFYNCVVLSAKKSLSSWMMLCVFTHLEVVAVWPSAEKNWVSEVLAEGKGSLA